MDNDQNHMFWLYIIYMSTCHVQWLSWLSIRLGIKGLLVGDLSFLYIVYLLNIVDWDVKHLHKQNIFSGWTA